MNIYSEKAQAKRDQFNKIINGCNMVLMNNIAEVDPSVYDNWEDASPMGNDECEIENVGKVSAPKYVCNTHGVETTDEYECDDHESDAEVYQWFAVNQNDADFLKRHGQYITYSDMLDTYFLAITHFGTSWDYTSMVDDFNDMYHGLEGLDEEKDAV